MDVHNSFILNTKKLGKIQLFLRMWMNKQNCGEFIYIWNTTQQQKEQTTDT